MSTSSEDKTKKRTLVLRHSSRAVNVCVSDRHGGYQSSRLTGSRKSLSLGGGSKVLDKSHVQTPRPAVRVFDKDDNDVTPQPLHQADPGTAQAKGSRFFLNEISGGSGSDQTTATGSFTMPFSKSVFESSRISSQSTIESVNEETEDTFSKSDQPISIPDVKLKKSTVKEPVTEDVLKEIIDIFLTETDTISLLDIPSTFVSVDSDEADTVIERNNQYAELCRNTMGNDDKYVNRSVQTLDGAAKHKHVQSDNLVMVDAGLTVTTWDMYNTLCDPEQEKTVRSPQPDKTDLPEAVVDSSRTAERSVSVGSTVSSVKDVDTSTNTANTDSELQLIVQSERFQHSLLVMERSILLNIFQPQLAAYRQLPVLEDPDSPVKPETVEQREEDTGSSQSLSPSLQSLWVFSCRLSRGRSVSSMAWNEKNPDLLAVGYGQFNSGDQEPGLVCCWSIKNPTWPERFIRCDSAVTCLDFSVNSPGQLAVGMHDGTIAIYNVHSRDKSRVISSHECPKKHLGPVCQLRWTLQELSLSGEDKAEALFSVGADGRICKWFVSSSGLDCTDLMMLKKVTTMKRPGGNKTNQTKENILSVLTPGLCFDFHPADPGICLAGTWEGLIHKCSCSNTQEFLETYQKHFSPVNCITWSPLSPDVFLSCSSDWTIQLWKQNHQKPVLGFTSTQGAVYDVRWSPKWATVFGAVNEQQLEIWDLKTSIRRIVLWSETPADK
ncbi:dynein axonemal intermediate chain 4 isoform X2 [Acanthochromis polyacanthus]|uniref:dynein axonemal intermediate chain 4 isoform X2 n=1 Tax=Acanthochromis polyacanthus TaxID=80966 RepID=UPI000B8F35CF|nr:dynein axonemal intermediate chain 4 isoform X2 [Acanthochromis polyacanthus]